MRANRQKRDTADAPLLHRIRTLNQKMDYAQEIASILRQTLSEKHSIHLEWIIIILIAVEVAFGVRHIWNEKKKEGIAKATDG